MASKTEQLTSAIRGEHVPISVAAGMARTQLVRDAAEVYDAKHLSDMLDLMARALSRVIPVWVRDDASGPPRPLTEAELMGVEFKRGATLVQLANGRSFATASVTRGDLREGIALLRMVGSNLVAAAERGGGRSGGAIELGTPAELLTKTSLIAELLRAPLDATRIGEAKRLALVIARRAPHGRISNLAMQLMSAIQAGEPARQAELLPRLRDALNEAERETK